MQQILLSAILKKRAVLLEGRKGAGKSSTAIAVAREYVSNSLLKEAVNEYQRIGRDEGFGDALITFGDAYWSLSDRQMAIETYKTLLT